MRPVRLEFCGLNSFSERAVIDFTPLLASGIFGIFGETGSGKSTILDAINFALYGDIERNSDKLDKINFRSEELYVSFTFDIFTDGARKTFLVERSIKRKSGTHRAMLYETDGGSSVALADNVKSVNDRITEIIGINKEDFRKCIALPQGEFAQFVNSAPGDRIELIERLFGLQKYGRDLKSKLSEREKDAQNRYSSLEGTLKAYEGVGKEQLEELKSSTAQLAAKTASLKAAAERAESEHRRLDRLYKQRIVYEKAVEELKNLEERKPGFDELEKALPALSACEKAVAKADEADAEGKTLARLESDGRTLAEKTEELAKKLAAAEQKYRSFSIEEAESAAKKSALMHGMQAAVSTFMSRGRELEKCRAEFEKCRYEYGAAVKLHYEMSEKLRIASEKFSSLKKPELETFFRKELRGGILKEEYARAISWIKELQAQLRKFGESTPLYEFVNDELAKKADEYRDLILTVKDARIDVAGALAEFDKLTEEYKNAEMAVNDLKTKIKTAADSVESCAARLEEVRAKGSSLRAEADELKAGLDEVFGADCKDYVAATAEAERHAREMAELRHKLEKELDSARRELGDAQGRAGANSAGRELTEKRKTAAEAECAQYICEAGLGGIAECRSLLEKFGSYKSANERYIKFTSEYSAAAGAVKGAACEEEALAVTEADVNAALEAKSAAAAAHAGNLTEVALAKSAENDMERRLNERRDIERKFAEANRERDLIGRLKSLIRDNKFMEYIASEHLINISHAASRTLIDLTDGRYYLSYTDNNFCVGDNFNGGELRKVKTLSGGETFLVSLSLALALSATICRRSMKSIEFFFLDEGFGTLDGDLIDTVLGALEKLKNDSFSIGLISHVEELKHRISSKIIVSKATESHGSTIRVSC